jgi:hypothetical protein
MYCVRQKYKILVSPLLNLTLTQFGWPLKNCCAIGRNEGNNRGVHSHGNAVFGLIFAVM